MCILKQLRCGSEAAAACTWPRMVGDATMSCRLPAAVPTRVAATRPSDRPALLSISSGRMVSQTRAGWTCTNCFLFLFFPERHKSHSRKRSQEETSRRETLEGRSRSASVSAMGVTSVNINTDDEGVLNRLPGNASPRPSLSGLYRGTTVARTQVAQ